MRATCSFSAVALAALCGLLAPAAPAVAGIITGTNGLTGLGTFDGDLTYNATGDHTATLQVTLHNTSDAANKGFLTAFAFNNPGGRITSAALTSTAPAFHLIGDPAQPGGVNGAPFGHFDLGASTGKSFEGGGNPNTGVGVGQTDLFWFTLNGNGLTDITEDNFLATPSAPPGAGQGTVAFVARFRGFSDGRSDKVPVDTVHIEHAPEPVTVTMGLIGVGLAAGAVALRRWAARVRPR